VLAKQQEPRVTTIAKQKRQRGIQRHRPTINDRTVMFFELIRSEIFTLPRPGNTYTNKNTNQNLAQSSAVNIATANDHLSSKNADPSDCNTCEILLDKLDAYENAINKIDNMSRAALYRFNRVNVGGRKPNYDIEILVGRIASKFYERKGIFAKPVEVFELVCEDLFNRDPRAYAESIRGKTKIDTWVGRHMYMEWWNWKTLPRPVSYNTVRKYLSNFEAKNSVS